MAAKKRRTSKRIVDPTPAGGGRNGAGQRPGAGKPGSKQAAKDRSKFASTQLPRRRISPAMIGWLSGAVIVILVAVFVVVAVTNKTPASANGGRTTLPASLVKQVTNVPASVLDAVGIGDQPAESEAGANAVDPFPASKAKTAALPTSGGKVPIFYFGAEFCPYCATERWSMIIALSRFGTFTGLEGMASDPGDVYPSTQTFTFYTSHYTSKYVNFLPVEDEDVNKNQLQTPNKAETKVLDAWDPAREFPFLDIGGKYMGGLPGWLNPSVLGGLTRSQIADDLLLPTNPAGEPIDANANYLTVAICSSDGDQPKSVCTSKGVSAALAQFKKLAPAQPLTSTS